MGSYTEKQLLRNELDISVVLSRPDASGRFTRSQRAALAAIRDAAGREVGWLGPVCTLSLQTIAKRSGVSLSNIRQAVQIALRLGLLERVPVNGPEDGLRNHGIGKIIGPETYAWPDRDGSLSIDAKPHWNIPKRRKRRQ